MKAIDSTAEILLWNYLNESVDEKWQDWAVAMMMAGFETEHLIELAGIEKPYNQFELGALTDKVFRELDLDYTSREPIVTNYATFLLKEVTGGKRDLLKTLRELKDACIALDYDEQLYDFYSLYFAKEDLIHSEVQWYWHDADRTTIDQVCLSYFEEWLAGKK